MRGSFFTYVLISKILPVFPSSGSRIDDNYKRIILLAQDLYFGSNKSEEGTMRIIFLVFILLSTLACSPTYVIYDPPGDVVEIVPQRPHGNVFWVKGHHVWRKGRWVWIPGHWKKDRAGRVWIAGHWKRTPRGWIWIEGRWSR
jgi:hypothetical protein